VPTWPVAQGTVAAMGRMDGKVVLVSGAARGQGEAEARLFAAEGATVAIADVLDDLGANVAASIGPSATYHHLDVSDLAQWEAVVADIVAAHGRLDVLVNNAGIFRNGSLLDGSLDDWDLVLRVNATGVMYGMRAAARQMVEQRSGSIVNISSIAGMQGSGGAIAYGASKWAVRGMTKTAARELAKHGIRVNSVHPGMIDTVMLDELGPPREKLMRGVPMRRPADASEVATVVLYLASDDSSYVTGSEHIVDGGVTA
jgi:3alpha(or 20beta)-hydroxysteroid dehydrogenase